MGKLQENSGKLASAVISAALLVAVPFIYGKEGDELQAYKDVAGVWTICGGVTGVAPGTTLTAAQCGQLTQSTIGHFMQQVDSLLKVVVTPTTLAAHTSFAYNIGLGGYKGSKALTLTNAGNTAAGCLAMANWYTAGGVDCRVRANGCYGVVQRRDDEVKLCLEQIQ